MALAVEGAELMLIGASRKYKESSNWYGRIIRLIGIRPHPKHAFQTAFRSHRPPALEIAIRSHRAPAVVGCSGALALALKVVGSPTALNEKARAVLTTMVKSALHGLKVRWPPPDTAATNANLFRCCLISVRISTSLVCMAAPRSATAAMFAAATGSATASAAAAQVTERMEQFLPPAVVHGLCNGVGEDEFTFTAECKTPELIWNDSMAMQVQQSLHKIRPLLLLLPGCAD